MTSYTDTMTNNEQKSMSCTIILKLIASVNSWRIDGVCMICSCERWNLMVVVPKDWNFQIVDNPSNIGRKRLNVLPTPTLCQGMQDNIEVGTNQVMSRLTSVSNGIINLNSLDLDSPGMLNFRFQGGFIFGRASKVQGCFEVPPPPAKKKS